VGWVEEDDVELETVDIPGTLTIAPLSFNWHIKESPPIAAGIQFYNLIHNN
jgi:hypothetical protein